MRIELDANSLGYGCKGLEIGVVTAGHAALECVLSARWARLQVQ